MYTRKIVSKRVASAELFVIGLWEDESKAGVERERKRKGRRMDEMGGDVRASSSINSVCTSTIGAGSIYISHLDIK